MPDVVIGWENKKNLKAEIFNKKASDPKNKPNLVLGVLGLQQGQKIANIGAGEAARA